MKVWYFISELQAKRKEILDAYPDPADGTTLHTEEDIICDIGEYADDKGYINGWGVVDDPIYDMPLSLIRGIDFVA